MSNAGNILREAAQLVHKRRIGGCLAIEQAAMYQKELAKANKAFKMFRPLKDASCYWWENPWIDAWKKYTPNQARILALLFAACIADDMEKK